MIYLLKPRQTLFLRHFNKSVIVQAKMPPQFSKTNHKHAKWLIDDDDKYSKHNLCSIIVLFCAHFLFPPHRGDPSASRVKQTNPKISRQPPWVWWLTTFCSAQCTIGNEQQTEKKNERKQKNNTIFNLKVLFALSTLNDKCCHCTQKSHFSHTFPLNGGVAFLEICRFWWDCVGFFNGIFISLFDRIQHRKNQKLLKTW